MMVVSHSFVTGTTLSGIVKSIFFVISLLLTSHCAGESLEIRHDLIDSINGVIDIFLELVSEGDDVESNATSHVLIRLATTDAAFTVKVSFSSFFNFADFDIANDLRAPCPRRSFRIARRIERCDAEEVEEEDDDDVFLDSTEDPYRLLNMCLRRSFDFL